MPPFSPSRPWGLRPRIVASVCLSLLLASPASQAAERVRLTEHPAEDRAPSWSPDGTRVLFESHRDGNSEIYVVGVDGSSLMRLTENAGADQYPAWAPDGERIVFQSERDGRSCLWVMEVDTAAGDCLLEDSSPELTPDWSPDGRWIAFTSKRSGNADLWAVSVEGGEPVRLTDSPFRDAWPRWSPDGNAIVLFSRRDTEGRRDELYILDWQSRAVRRVTVNPDYHDFAPDWSPDGERIVTGLSDSDSERALVVYDLRGKELHRFAEGLHRVFQPTWSPDGRWIAFAARTAEGLAADIFLEPALR